MKNLKELIDENMEDDEIFYAVTEDAMEQEMEIGYDDLSDLEKNSYLIGKYLMEINNGGFDQYFLNTEGRYAKKDESPLSILYILEVVLVYNRTTAITYSGRVNAIIYPDRAK